jgi:glycosyltransferase involved in cell wall biosynthesis
MLLKPDNSFCKAAHGVSCVECLPPQFVPIQKILLSFRRSIFDRCFDKLDTFIVLSEHSAGVLQGYGIDRKKIAVVPLTLPIEYGHSVDETIFEPQSILFAGWLNDRKGVHIAIEAMIDVLKEVPQVKLYVIGGKAKFSEEYECNFQKIIEEHQLSDHIVFLGHQKPEVVEQYLQRVAVLVIPEQYENMSPLIMIEGMLLGKPVVASNLGGIPEYIQDGETGFLADAYKPKEFAQKIITVLQDSDLGKRIGQAAQQYIQSRNNNEVIWERTLKAYQACSKGDYTCNLIGRI